MTERRRDRAGGYDAVVVVSFGGPEAPDHVMPFLQNVTRGRGVPEERLREVAGQYAQFGGVSPINGHNRTLIAALEAELAAHGLRLPIYFGNRNWHPLLEDTVARMVADGIGAALAFVTSAYSSYSGCRQYREDIERARAAAGADAPSIDKIRAFWNHPGFIEPMAENLAAALAGLSPADRAAARVVFTAHSLPRSLASTCDYESQLEDAAVLIADRAGVESWDRAYQSRSGPPSQPWLEPDIVDHIDVLHGRGVRTVVVVPAGFISDHMEVVYDLDTQARRHAENLGMRFVRVPTVGTHPRFVSMIRELIEERIDPGAPRRALGRLGPRPDQCPPDCCPAPQRPSMQARTPRRG